MADNANYQIVGVNMTKLFTRERVMYSLGDIRLHSPVSLKKAGYTMLFLLMWSLPIYLLFGISFTPLYFVFFLGPPFLLSYLATSNIFGGKNLIDFATTQVKYFLAPRGWMDLRAKSSHISPSKNKFDERKYYVANEIWISRRRELWKLQEMKRQASGENK